jgi:CheY-like chemotaxis protein/tetratricopeptide (TPR) repeat protein
VKHPTCALLLGAAVALAWPAPLAAQMDEPFQPPQTPAEHWAALKYQISVGRYDLAARYLQGFLATNPTDQDLLALEQREGLAGFLQLRLVERWSNDDAVNKQAKANVEEAINRVTAALRKQRTDPARIARFVKNLTGLPEEAAFAENELRLAGAAAMPALVAQLRDTQETAERAVILRVIGRMPVETVPPLLASLDISDPTRQAELMNLALGSRRDLLALTARPETDPTPTLFHLSASPQVNPVVRQQATELLARILGRDPSRLPAAPEALTRAAERFWRHEARFGDAQTVPVWRWTGNALEATPSTPSQAEEHSGLRYLRWALEIDPNYKPAQALFLAMAVEKGYERGGLDKPLPQAAPEVYAIAAAASTDALIAGLDRALREQRSGAALGLVQALGNRAEVKAARPEGHRPGVLVRALDSGDRRVQLAAAEALLNMPGPPVHDATSRVIEVLRRAVLADPQPGAAAPQGEVLIGDFDQARGLALANELRRGGYRSEVVRTGKEVVRRLGEAADIDVVVVHAMLPYMQLPELMASLRADTRSGVVPVVVLLPAGETALAHDDREWRIRQFTSNDPRVRIVRGALTPEVLAQEVGQPGSAPAAPIPEAERKAMAARAIEGLRRAALGQAGGFDVRPAEAAIRAALRDPDLAPAAIEAASRLPVKEAQQDLANVVLGGPKPELRARAATALVRHLQQYGVVLTPMQVQQLRALAAAADTPPEVRTPLAAVVGGLNPTAVESSGRLIQFQPPAAAPAAPMGTTPPVTPPAPMPPGGGQDR